MSKGVGLGFRPVHAVEVPVDMAVLAHQIPFRLEPGVQVDAALEGLEPMVRDHEEGGLIIHILHRAAEHAVSLLIEIENGCAEFLSVLSLVGGMVVGDIAEEHMLNSIGCVEDDQVQAALVLRQMPL